VLDYGAGWYGPFDGIPPPVAALSPRSQIARYGYKAGAGSPISISVNKDASKLRIEAVVLDTVSDILPDRNEDRDATQACA
jgi:hypothetical protein